jgi:nucleoid-associated protein YgaU
MEKKPIFILAALALAGLGAVTYAQRDRPGTPVAVTPKPEASTQVAAKPEAAAPKAAETPEVAEAPKAPEAVKSAEAPAAEQQVAVAKPPKAAEPPKAEAPAAPGIPLPSFDTVRVEDGGEALIAGRAEPSSEIVIKHNGSVIASGMANSDGAFAITPDKPLPEGPGVISIEMKTKDKMVASQQTVAVAVQPKAGEKPMVAVLTPGEPTKMVQTPGAAKPALEPMKTVNIDSVDYDEKGNMIFGGRGPAGNKVQLYVDNKPYDEAEIGPDGTWTLAGKAPLSVGAHTMRADEIGPDGGVKSRVEMPFFREDAAKVVAAKVPPPEAPKTTTTTTTVVVKDAATGAEVKADVPVEQQTAKAEAPKIEESAPLVVQQPDAVAGQAKAEEPATAAKPAEVATTQPPNAAAPAAEAVKPAEPDQQTAAVTAPAIEPAPAAQPVPDPTITIQPGNNLWRLSRGIYGKGMMYTVIFEANKDHIRNPNLIYPGQVFVTPRGEAKAAN